MKSLLNRKIAILGCGNIGFAIVKGLTEAKVVRKKNLILTRRSKEAINNLKSIGFNVTSDNKKAVENSEIVILTVTPHQAEPILKEIKKSLNPKKHIIFSVVSGLEISAIKKKTVAGIPVVRVMPNTAIAIGESMTCLSSDEKETSYIQLAEELFNNLGKTLIIKEELMVAATVLGACGIAFFLRAIRAASQGGIEIGFHAEEALYIAAQTAKGAASILLDNKSHPEKEVDKVTTPQGCTIAGLNEMEHNGFSSSLIKGIVTSAEKCAKLS